MDADEHHPDEHHRLRRTRRFRGLSMYTSKALGIIAAVFADDVGAGFPKARLEDYLKVRLEYSKLINIDSVGPETIRPVTKFTGVDIARNRPHELAWGWMGDDCGHDDWVLRPKRERCGDPLNWGYRCVCGIPQVGGCRA